MPNIQDTFGAMFVGVLISMIIYGITTIQAYFYYAQRPKGDYEAKVLVAGIWILDTLHIGLLFHTLWFYLIADFGNVNTLLEGTWSLFTSMAVNVLVAFIVQCYFTRRILNLSFGRHKRWIPVVIAFFVFAHFLFGIEMVLYLFIKKLYIHIKEIEFRSILPHLITAVSSDVLIAMELCLLLANDQGDFLGPSRHDTMNTIIVYAFHRCILTAVITIIELVIFVILPNFFFAATFGFIIGRLYGNSLLATLNARPVMRLVSFGKETSTSFHLATRASHMPSTFTRIPRREVASYNNDHEALGMLDMDSIHSPRDTDQLSQDGIGLLDYG